MSQDIVLRPFDIVYVPKSPIANVNVWVDQYVRKNLPIYYELWLFLSHKNLSQEFLWNSKIRRVV